MERKKGSYILNDISTTWTGRAQAIHVLTAAKFSAITDTRRGDRNYYISDSNENVAAGAYIVARDGALFTGVQISGGSIEIIF